MHIVLNEVVQERAVHPLSFRPGTSVLFKYVCGPRVMFAAFGVRQLKSSSSNTETVMLQFPKSVFAGGTYISEVIYMYLVVPAIQVCGT